MFGSKCRRKQWITDCWGVIFRAGSPLKRVNQRERERERERDRETERQRETERDRERQRQRQTETESNLVQ